VLRNEVLDLFRDDGFVDEARDIDALVLRTAVPASAAKPARTAAE
jgi:hypothetical protein